MALKTHQFAWLEVQTCQKLTFFSLVVHRDVDDDESNVGGGGGRGLGSMDRIETAPPPRGERNDEFTLDELQKKIYNWFQLRLCARLSI